MNIEVVNHQIGHSVGGDSGTDCYENAELWLKRPDSHDGNRGARKDNWEKIVRFPAGTTCAVMAAVQKMSKTMKDHAMSKCSDWLHHQKSSYCRQDHNKHIHLCLTFTDNLAVGYHVLVI